MSNRSATHMDQASSIVGHGHTPKMPYGGNQGQFTPQHMNKTPLQQCLDSSNHGLIDSEKKPGGPPTTLLANSTTAIAPNLPLQGTPKQIGGLKNALVINESPIPAPSDCSWVTVFGFPPSSSSLILSQFSRVRKTLRFFTIELLYCESLLVRPYNCSSPRGQQLASFKIRVPNASPKGPKQIYSGNSRRDDHDRSCPLHGSRSHVLGGE